MINTTYLRIVQIIEAFASSHLNVQRFHSDFEEQIDNFGTQGENYPILYMTPNNVSFSGEIYTDLTTFTIDFYALDILQKDQHFWQIHRHGT
jgi:hypothetical protein